MAYQSVIRCPDGNALVKVRSSQRVVDGSILLVPADNVAFVCINGIVSAPYGPGRHEINTGVSPFFVGFRNIMTQGDPGITCQIFFVNTVQEMYEQGGTGNMIFQEKRFKISMNAMAAYTIRYVISNPRVFISKLVGMHNNSFENEDIKPAINSLILPTIKEAVITSISNSTVHNIQQGLTGISQEARGRLTNSMRDYGIALKAVVITAINIPAQDLQRLNELEEKDARGRLNTDLEVDNIERVYGDVNTRTMAEFLTGSVRGPANRCEGRSGAAEMAGAIAAIPWQIEMAKIAMEQMNRSMPNLMGTGNTNNQDSSVTVTQPTSYISDTHKMPPPVPKKPKVCKHCGKQLNLSDIYCKYCGARL